MQPTIARSEDLPTYGSAPADTEHGDELIRRALVVLLQRLRTPGPTFDAPRTVKDFCTLRLATAEAECFDVLFLDAQHRLIEARTMFTGTLTQTSVYPREVVKQALALNAGAVILAHNHPSGLPEPSRADEFLTQTLKSALVLVDVRVLDHLIVGGSSVTSFAERGLL